MMGNDLAVAIYLIAATGIFIIVAALIERIGEVHYIRRRRRERIEQDRQYTLAMKMRMDADEEDSWKHIKEA